LADKYFLSYAQVHEIIKNLSVTLKNEGIDPDCMVAIGTGGFIPARMLKTFLNKPILTVGIAYYDLYDKPTDKPIITQWIDNPEKQIKGRKILLVDEVDDSRATIGFCLEELLKHEPAEISVLVLQNKKKEKTGTLPIQIKKYYAGEEVEDLWICYPWDADNIRSHEKEAEKN